MGSGGDFLGHFGNVFARSQQQRALEPGASCEQHGTAAVIIKALVGDQINEEQLLTLTLMDTHDESGWDDRPPLQCENLTLI